MTDIKSYICKALKTGPKTGGELLDSVRHLFKGDYLQWSNFVLCIHKNISELVGAGILTYDDIDSGVHESYSRQIVQIRIYDFRRSL